MTSNIETRNRCIGLILVAIVLGMTIYSYFVIKARGKLPEPTNLSRVQTIWRGL